MTNKAQNESLVCSKDEHANATRKRAVHVYCPSCRHRASYRLSDGRRKCKKCGKKFTARKKTRRLPDVLLKEIARLFWLLVPATRVARNLGVNRNTVMRYYTIVRVGVASEREKEFKQLAGEVEVDEAYFGGIRKGKRGRGAGGKCPVFGLLKRDGEVRVLFPARLDRTTLHAAIKTNVVPQSWVYSDSYSAYDRIDLEGFKHARINHSESFGKNRVHINGIENFWGFAKRRLKLYHGGFKRNFPLFIREMEFRFNHRNDMHVIDHLFKLLKFSPV